MAKRTHGDNDGSGVEDASPSSKRARTAGGNEGADGPSGSTQRAANKRSNATKKGKGKARQDASDDEEDADADEEDLDEEDEEEMRRQEKLIHAKLAARRKQVGGVAEHGIIESIEMHQFMCHKFLSFTFGPQINFIIGKWSIDASSARNIDCFTRYQATTGVCRHVFHTWIASNEFSGGKSAVLSAITIALGGKSNFTGRGNGLKSFIREGQNVSEITISLKNQGEEAFKPKEYGKSILITRRFTKDGSSTWKIRSHDGKKVISTKKDELAAICDHMNIQVDNPMNVLTQDAARQFLSASQPGEKYQFFLRGTQLSQLSEEYEICLENIHSTEKILEQKKSLLPELKERRKEAQLRFDEAKKARDQKERIEHLRKERAWALVNSKQKELEGRVLEQEKLLQKIAKIQEDKAKAEKDVGDATEEIKNTEEEMEAMGSQDELQHRHADLKEECRGLKAKIMNYKNDLGNINSQIREINAIIQGLDKEIAEQTQRLATDTQAKREEHQRQINEATAAVTRYENDRSQSDRRLEEIGGQIKETESTGMNKGRELESIQQRIGELQAQIQSLDKAEKDRYSPYAPNMMQILNAIKQTRWFGETPVGPLGVYIKVKDAQRWADLLSIQLGSILISFAVSDPKDMPTLKKLLNNFRYQDGRARIFIQERDIFDYSKGEPAPGLPTVLRAIDVTDPWVLRILINQRRIESMFLGNNRSDAERILGQVGAGQAWSADGFFVRRFPEGGGSSAPIERGGNNQNRVFLSGGDSNARKNHLKTQLAEMEAQYHPLNDEVQGLKRKFSDLKKEENNIINKGRQVDQGLQQAKRHLRQLQNEVNEEVPINIGALEDNKREQEEQKETILNQGAEVNSKKTQQEQVLKEKLEEVTRIKKQLNEYQEVRNGYTSKIEEAAERRLRAQATVKHRDDQLKTQQTLLDEKKAQVDNCEEEFKKWTEGATKISPERVQTNRKPEDIEKQMDSLTSALREREKRQGATVDELEDELNRTTALLDAAQKDWKKMNDLNKMLKDSLNKRLYRWQEFRRHIALRCKMVFKYNLSQRGYYGNIIFNHNAGKLELKVQTDDQNATQGARDKDPKALSGGEKSFSTICLLLALWESIGCPLRCLDEFDVFMDAVNRRIAMRMMIDTANQSDKKQYILITPQDMNNIHIGPTVRVHRMTDPERGQGVLAMG
ncbi:hypothetical protein D9758_002600 [Tetrapyrgos nigripes]|uniref:RecF/RecN/SMC N-terminal domain-containing protein n=1 Tax=Tetrapyrgos nigripes TaxID=182062 RepID=A0A8H5GQN0_9AGAR|nr:hypothetical protein D9758_002600 [Tetrapyrgos nigripes]